MSTMGKWARVFGHFWWDFLVGDTPELFVATVVIVGAALLVRNHGDTGYVLLPLLAIASLVISAYRGRRRRETETPQAGG